MVKILAAAERPLVRRVYLGTGPAKYPVQAVLGRQEPPPPLPYARQNLPNGIVPLLGLAW